MECDPGVFIDSSGDEQQPPPSSSQGENKPVPDSPLTKGGTPHGSPPASARKKNKRKAGKQPAEQTP
eukprot:12512608-Heterocapsa_arctica.AAC.1